MGLFVHFVGQLECVRCRRISDAMIQTKLLRHEADNSSREYRVGDAEELVGLEDYCPLEPWDHRSLLVVGVGDWDCDHCGLAWQWAKVSLGVALIAGRTVAAIHELSSLQPFRASDLIGIHFVEDDLAKLSNVWDTPPPDRPVGLQGWQAYSVAERRERLAVGFRKWCREVAGVNQDD